MRNTFFCFLENQTIPRNTLMETLSQATRFVVNCYTDVYLEFVEGVYLNK